MKIKAFISWLTIPLLTFILFTFIRCTKESDKQDIDIVLHLNSFNGELKDYRILNDTIFYRRIFSKSEAYNIYKSKKVYNYIRKYNFGKSTYKSFGDNVLLIKGYLGDDSINCKYFSNYEDIDLLSALDSLLQNEKQIYLQKRPLFSSFNEITSVEGYEHEQVNFNRIQGFYILTELILHSKYLGAFKGSLHHEDHSLKALHMNNLSLSEPSTNIIYIDPSINCMYITKMDSVKKYELSLSFDNILKNRFVINN